jgi:hypothetical protein|tara:strand:- start:4768 stop:4989 length:222 start_codon:yes stop_codon:yes gene_type:complete
MNQMSFTILDAWGQREQGSGASPKEQPNKPKQKCLITMYFEWDPNREEHPADWKWKELLGVDYIEIEEIEDIE